MKVKVDGDGAGLTLCDLQHSLPYWCFLEPRPNLAYLYAVNTFCLCWRSSLMLTTVNIDSMCQFISNKAAELLSFAKDLVFVLVFAFVICLCLIVCRSLSAGWFHGCGPSAWNCHSFPMGSFASFRALFSLSLIFFFFYALKLFDFIGCISLEFSWIKKNIWDMEYDYEKVRLLVVNSLS